MHGEVKDIITYKKQEENSCMEVTALLFHQFFSLFIVNIYYLFIVRRFITFPVSSLP